MSAVLASPRARSVDAALTALRGGGFVLLYDADGREEETDLVIAAEFASPDAVRRMRNDAGGLLCATLHPRVHRALDLPYLSDLLLEAGRTRPLLARLARADVPYEPGATKPSFTLAVNHRATFTGVTDLDRSRTLQALAVFARDAGRIPDEALRDHFAGEFKAPGHVPLLNAHPKLLGGRRGHTELATALLEMAGLAPAAVLCEMMNGPSGRALPKADAIKYAAQNDLVFLQGTEVLDAWTLATEAAPSTAATR